MSATTELRLPQLADSVTSVRLSAWLKQEGERVVAGEPIAEVETDKTNVELEAPVSGVVREIQVSAGTDGLEAGVLLAVIAEGDSASGLTPSSTSQITGDTAASRAPAPPERTPAPLKQDDPMPVSAGDVDEDSAVDATPLARRMAAAAGLDLSVIRAEAAHGRVGKADVDRVLSERRRPSTGSGVAPSAEVSPVRSVSSAPNPTPVTTVPHHDQPLTAMRRVTAVRMQQAKQTVPHFYLRTECRVDTAFEFLASVKRTAADVVPTVTDLVIRATACALRTVPHANAAWVDGAVRLYDRVDIAVAVDTPTGLVTPVVRDAGRKDLAAIASETQMLAGRARNGRLAPEEYHGGT
ncbi:MAG: dihydrolipoamide acetyltransferase family protein, partial [Acidobacteriota bacterium]|nr:dihydrolipoamide acetyltransferase family protein [Acidobacteriota bacterium]